MNKKGFTTIELIISFVMVIILLASLINFTINYRDRVKKEEVISELYDFKNTITKTVYDDIINLNYISISSCVGQDNCVNFTDKDSNSHVLKIENICDNVNCSSSPGSCTACNLSNCGVYVNYDGTRYLLPESNLNKFYKDSCDEIIKISESASDLKSFELKNYEGSLYNLKMTFKHFRMDNDLEILLTIN